MRRGVFIREFIAAATRRNKVVRLPILSAALLVLVLSLGVSRLGAETTSEPPSPRVELQAAGPVEASPLVETVADMNPSPEPALTPQDSTKARWAPEPGTAGSIIGSSQGGQPLVINHLGDGASPVLILGGQHGGPEENTVRLVVQLLDYFGRNPDTIPANLRLDVLSVANPDGRAHGSRQFLSGVDPNRNWGGRDWASDGWDSNAVFRRGLGGPEPFSEPETQALRDYVALSRPVLVVNYHSRGGFIFGGNGPQGGSIADAYSEASGYFRPRPGGGGGSVAAPSVLGYRATGSMNAWLGDEGYRGMLIELATSFDAEFSRNLAGLRSALAALAEEAE